MVCSVKIPNDSNMAELFLLIFVFILQFIPINFYTSISYQYGNKISFFFIDLLFFTGAIYKTGQ